MSVFPSSLYPSIALSYPSWRLPSHLDAWTAAMQSRAPASAEPRSSSSTASHNHTGSHPSHSTSPPSASSGTAVHRHPFVTRTPSNEPSQFHLSPSSSSHGSLGAQVAGPSTAQDSSLYPQASSSNSASTTPVNKWWPEAPAPQSSRMSYPAHHDAYRHGDRSPVYPTTLPAGGYASSTDGDMTPMPPSSLGSRAQTPLIGVNLGEDQIADMTESEISEYDEHTKMRRNKRSAPTPNGTASPSSMLSSLSKSLKTDSFWSKPSTSYSPLTNARSRSLKKSKWNRAPKTDKSLFTTSSASSSRNRGGRRTTSPWTQPLHMTASFFLKIFRTIFGPIHPVTIVVALFLIASFVVTVTKIIVYILNPDKEPLPWRTYCQNQPAFPHAYADALAPVDIFVGVFSIDSAYERRHLIRSTYATHTMPVDPHTGTPMSNVQLKFILGKPRQAHARRVALELETFNDLVILDMEENMNKGKTHAFFQWAAENATVPFLRPVGSDEESSDYLGGLASLKNGYGQTGEVVGGTPDHPQRYQIAWKKADYVVKADDDAYIVLDELERHLRVAPRTMTYWGYLIRNWFMGGECYALSNDLVQYAATSDVVSHFINGKEDKKVAQWINLHPNRSDIHWVSEHCWIYDHPKAGTAYSHGFLFPDYVEKIKLEGRRGLTDQEIARRGGEHGSKSYSTVTRWHSPYVEPRSDLTIEEEVEALVEGGGRWAGTWVRGEEGNNTQVWVPWDQMVFEASDVRFKPQALTSLGSHPTLAEEVGIDAASGLTIRRIHQMDDYRQARRDRPTQNQKRDVPFLAHLPSVPGFDFGTGGVSRSAADGRRRAFASSASQPRLIPLPTHKDSNGEVEELRDRRFLGRRFGGTVVVHYLKKSEWFYETALALTGKDRFWTDGAGGTGSEWRMYGSPLVRHEDGYVSGGRSQPRPDMEMAYLQQARVQAQANAAQAKALAARMGSFTKPKPATPAIPPPQHQEQDPPQNTEPPPVAPPLDQ